MPGLSLSYARNQPIDPDDPTDTAWERAVEATRCDSTSVQRIAFRDSRLKLGISTYSGYPLEILENDRALVCLEGRAYGIPPERALKDLLAAAESLDSVADAVRIRSLVDGWDGDYVAVLYAKAARRLCIAPDPVGRLPLYARIDDSALSVTRDQRFLLELSTARAPDRLGIAQLLVFGYPIGRATLIEGVERLPPGQLLVADAGGVRCEASAHALDLEHKARASMTARRNAEELADVFVHACRVRADAVAPVMLGLSGGLDSRAVGAALARASVPFDAVTFVDSSGFYEKEVAIARAVAETLGAPWQLFPTPAPRGDRMRRLLHMKTGLNTLAMAFGLDFFDMLRAAHGPRRSYWSGDGGDKVLPDHRPRLDTRQRADVTQYLIEKNHVWATEQVGRLVGLRASDVSDSVRAVVDRYPERAPDQRCVRFLLSERAQRWISEGEDTNRHYYWTVSPFVARTVTEAAMACPDQQKTGHRLYRQFMRNLSPSVARIVDANLGIAMSSPLYVWNRSVRQISRRFPRLQRLLRRGSAASVLKPSRALVRDFLLRQAEHSSTVRELFSVAEIRGIASDLEHANDYALECLITATSAVEEIVERRSTLDEFAEVHFG